MTLHRATLRQVSMNRSLLSVFGFVLLMVVSAAFGADQPNIVIILADDLGYGSLNSYGADEAHICTPNIDRMAKKGMRFTDANTPSSVCSPTRYGLLTGRYDWRTDQKHGVVNTTDPLHIKLSRSTIASLLKSVGYRTAAIGKWHLGYGADKADFTKTLSPRAAGYWVRLPLRRTTESRRCVRCLCPQSSSRWFAIRSKSSCREVALRPGVHGH